MSYDLSRTLFSIGSKHFTCSDFMEALKFFGIYEEWCGGISKRKALLERKEKAGEEIDREILSEMTNNFRYSEKLLTTEEFSHWLATVGLSLTDFESFLKRAYWAEIEDDSNVGEGLKISNEEFFSEMYFSRSFEGLLQSWKKRLLAWFDKNDSDFPELEKLNEHYKKFELDLLQHFDKDLWVNCFRKEFNYYDLSCLFGGEKELQSLSKKLENENFEDAASEEDLEYKKIGLYFRDLPDTVREFLHGVKEGSIFGPLRMDDNFVLCRLEALIPASEDDEDIIEELQTQFIDDIWKTLEVKYVS